jgi:predicted ribosomally synthesized peptide with SipW-like signal peptide
MKKIIGLSIAALLIISIVAVGTFAYFSDTAVSTGNTFTAGTLILSEVSTGSAVNNSYVVTPAGGINGSVQFGLTDPVKPGSSGTITWTLTNGGNVAGTLTMATTTSFTENPSPNTPQIAAWAGPAGHVGLSEDLQVWVTRTVDSTTTNVLGATGGYVSMGPTTAGLATALSSETQSLVTGHPWVYVLNWKVLDTTGNEIQGDSASLSIIFTLNQTH